MICSFSAAHKEGCGGCPIKAACTGAQVGPGWAEIFIHVNLKKKKKSKHQTRKEERDVKSSSG